MFPEGNVNVKIEYKQKDYMTKNTYMGKFIDEHYILPKKYSSSKGTGTILNKMSFAKCISNNIYSINDLTPQAINLCKKILVFIQDSNKI